MRNSWRVVSVSGVTVILMGRSPRGGQHGLDQRRHAVADGVGDGQPERARLGLEREARLVVVEIEGVDRDGDDAAGTDRRQRVLVAADQVGQRRDRHVAVADPRAGRLVAQDHECGSAPCSSDSVTPE